MRCRDARHALLEAEIETLEGVGSEPLAQHVRECPNCSSYARAIVEGEIALGDALADAAPTVDLEEVIEAAGKGGMPEARKGFSRWRPWAGTGRGLALLPLAAAAAATALFLGRPSSLPGPPYAPPPPTGGLDVQAPAGGTVAVMETNNPDITVLWLLDGGS